VRWDLFCRVIDNHGDAGVCWRLARDLAGRGEAVRLWIDDASALSWMAPGGAAGIDVMAWAGASTSTPHGDVVVEAFGCELPDPFIAAMAAAAAPPTWINLEYLSAEAYVERSHGLRSPRLVEPGAGLDKWFFYPGFTRATGGLIREPGLKQARLAHDGPAWLAARGWHARQGERVVSLFCYDTAPLADWLGWLVESPTLLLVPPGAPQRVVQPCKASTPLPGRLRVLDIPWQTQEDYDRLLWSCDLNFVRGEDSFVRAQWAEVPFIWQIYPQHDGAHWAKLDAFLGRFLADTKEGASASLHALFHSWNGAGDRPAAAPDLAEWLAHCQRWSNGLQAQDSLTEQLLAFCRSRRPGCC